MEKKRKSKTLWVTTTALMLALVVLAQLLSKAIPAALVIPTPLGIVNVGQLITGSLVNLVLIIAADTVGISGGSIAALLSPLLAALFAIIPGGLPVMIPVVMIGNLLIVVVTGLCFRESYNLFPVPGNLLRVAGIVLGAVAKAAALWALTVKLILPLFHVSGKIAAMLGVAMSWSQLFTALMGGILALIILPVVTMSRRRA